MPVQQRPDFQRLSTGEVLDAVARREPLALAEAYNRTGHAAHAVARRILGSIGDVELVLTDVYGSLWASPPSSDPLEAWVRHATFTKSRRLLRERGRQTASPSAGLLIHDAQAPMATHRVEQAILDLDDAAMRALLLAHDRGSPTAEQSNDSANADLRRALLLLAEDSTDYDDCGELRLADYVLGLVHDNVAATVEDAIGNDRTCAELAKALRKGRRRIEGLPPPPDLGQRVLVSVLTTAGLIATPREQPPRETATRAQPLAQEPAPEPTPSATAGRRAAPAAPAAPAAATGAAADATGTAAHRREAQPDLDELISELPAARGRAGNLDESDTDEISLRKDQPHDDGPETAAFEQVYDTPSPSAAEPAPPAAAPQPAATEGAPEAYAALREEGEAEPPRGRRARRTAEAEEDLWFSDTGSEQGQVGAPAAFDDGDEEAYDDRAYDYDEAEGDDEASGGGGRRAVTVLLTVLGALLLLAAGAVGGLLIIRVVLG